jgi:hypothetical protein
MRLFIVAALIIAWCVLDAWNHDTRYHLFQMKEAQDLRVDKSGTVHTLPVKCTLTLAFLQFLFTGIAVFLLCKLTVKASGESLIQNLASLQPTLHDARWSALVSTHMFGSFLIHSVMMPSIVPAQMMSLSLIAAARALQNPFAAALRTVLCGKGIGGPSMQTSMLMFASAWLIFFSYTQIAECLCIWNGYGLALTGMSFYFVYSLVITVPAVDVVLQEAVIVKLEVHPILMLGCQNICAAMFFTPILIGAHALGFEDVPHAIDKLTSHREIFITVQWLCVQHAAISAVTVGLILTVGSFWATATRSLRAVFWWARQLVLFYFTSTELLVEARPHASLWSIVMGLGIVLGLSACFNAWIRDSRLQEAFESQPLAIRCSSTGWYV